MKTEYTDVAALQALLASEAIYAVLDVRERGEFALQQIPGTIPLPRGTLEYAPSDLKIEPFNCSPEGVTGTLRK